MVKRIRPASPQPKAVAARDDAQGLVYALHRERPIDPVQVKQLYETVGWWSERDPATIASGLDDCPAIGAWDGNRLIAFARVVCDRYLRASIEDVVVHPDYRRRGIATRMLACLLNALPHESVTLFCLPELIPLYARAGFELWPRRVVMHRYQD